MSTPSHANMSPGQEKQRVALWSLLASGGLAAVKFAAALVSGSLGLLSEAFHSLLDFGATALTLLAVRISDKPADDDHHYGHAKAESLVALIEAGMLIAVSLWVVYEAVTRLIAGSHELRLSWWLFAIVIASIIIDFNRSRVLKATAEKTSSAALAADALHFAADMWSSLAVLIGLALVWFGFGWADSVAALVVAGFVARAAWNLGRQTLDNLLDAAPAGVAASINRIVEAHPVALGIRQLRVRPAGPTTFVDLTVDVPRTRPAAQLEAIRHELEATIEQAHAGADCSIRLNPIELDSETVSDKVEVIAEKHDVRLHHITVQRVAGRLAISFDMEVDASMPLLEAHEKATRLEADIRESLGADVEVESHIEPKEPQSLDGAAAAPKLVQSVETALTHFVRKERSVTDLHNIRIRENASGLYVHYHCRFDPQMQVAKVHEVSERIEVALMASMPEIKRVIAHAEPVGQGKHKL
jgi:cation diffusion facilitator family transporter